MEKKKNKGLYIIILIIAILICAVAVFVVFKTILDKPEELNVKNTVAATESADSLETDMSVTEALAENPINFAQLQEENSDLYSWIYIPNTNIDYAVAQYPGEDQSFYLNHNIYKDYEFAGTIYSETNNRTDYSDPVTVLYGHNMLNGSMFANLHKFSDGEFFENNKDMFVYTPNHILTYEIYSAFEYDNRHILNSFDFSDEKVFKEFIDYTLNPRSTNANVREGAKITSQDKLLVLSTCGNDYRDIRYLVVGVLVDDKLTQ